MANDILKAIEKIGYKSVLDVNGKPVVSHDNKRYVAEANGNIYEIIKRSTTSTSGYPGFSVAIEPGYSKTYPCHHVMMYTFNGHPEKYFIDHKKYRDSNVTDEEWEACPQSIKDAYKKAWAKGRVVDHIDPDKNNYRADNLQYLTLHENSSKGDK